MRIPHRALGTRGLNQDFFLSETQISLILNGAKDQVACEGVRKSLKSLQAN